MLAILFEITSSKENDPMSPGKSGDNRTSCSPIPLKLVLLSSQSEKADIACWSKGGTAEARRLRSFGNSFSFSVILRFSSANFLSCSSEERRRVGTGMTSPKKTVWPDSSMF